MKKLALIFSLLFSLSAQAKENINNLVFEDFYKQKVTLQDYHIPFKDGMLVNVWATWCPPCVKELPNLMLMQQLMPNITVVAINVDDDINKPKKFLKQNNLPLHIIPHLYDKEALKIKKLGAKRLPVSFLLNKNGEIVEIIKGYRNWSSEFTMAEISAKL